MKKRILGLTLSASLMALSVSAQAITIAFVDVDARANPWEITANPSNTYGTSGSTGPEVVTGGGFDFTAGSLFNIIYVAGSISLGAHPSLAVNGDSGIASGVGGGLKSGNSGLFFPSNSIGANILLGAIVGTFADATGAIVGNPFAISNSSVFVAPTGATQLLFGINDDIFGDNTGVFTLIIDQDLAAVPIPAAVWLFGSALVGLVGMRRTKKS